MRYHKYDLVNNAKEALNYIDSMTDRKYNFLPFWLTMPHKKPAEAEHCRVDDAELVGSWFEAVDSLINILGHNDTLDELYNGFRNRLLMSWGECDLRYSEYYPWTHSIYASFHEMGYILPALNRIVKNNPKDLEIEEKASKLVRGMRSLVIERKTRTFWSGDQEEAEPIYEFPNDVYEKGGFNYSKHTGRGEQAIRNAVSLHALVDRYVIAHDEVALDLAIGIANHLLGPSRYFNYKFEFFGHVHSSLWVAAGLIYLSRVTKEDKYFKAGLGIYNYVKSLGSSFGWIPEYAQWKEQALEHCETCCLKDLILVCDELIKSGYTEYYKDLDLVTRNQLDENQIHYTGYVVSSNKDDENGHTFKNLDKRLLGGFTGGSKPNSISLTKFRSIAGCCVGTGPIALSIAWDRVVDKEMVNNEIVNVVNIVTDKVTDSYKLTSLLPEFGIINLEVKKEGLYGFRIYDYMKDYKISVDDKEIEYKANNDVSYAYIEEGSTLSIKFNIETIEKEEFFEGHTYKEFFRGNDLIDILPRGEHVRLYQRDYNNELIYPTPDDVEWTGVADRGPTQQKH